MRFVERPEPRSNRVFQPFAFTATLECKYLIKTVSAIISPYSLRNPRLFLLRDLASTLVLDPLDLSVQFDPAVAVVAASLAPLRLADKLPCRFPAELSATPRTWLSLGSCRWLLTRLSTPTLHRL